jgi:hypothetical protein
MLAVMSIRILVYEGIGEVVMKFETRYVAWGAEQSRHGQWIEYRIAFKWHRQPKLPPQHVVNSHTLYHNSTATKLSIDFSTADVSWGLEHGQATRDAPGSDLYRRRHNRHRQVRPIRLREIPMATALFACGCSSLPLCDLSEGSKANTGGKYAEESGERVRESTEV